MGSSLVTAGAGGKEARGDSRPEGPEPRSRRAGGWGESATRGEAHGLKGCDIDAGGSETVPPGNSSQSDSVLAGRLGRTSHGLGELPAVKLVRYSQAESAAVSDSSSAARRRTQKRDVERWRAVMCCDRLGDGVFRRRARRSLGVPELGRTAYCAPANPREHVPVRDSDFQRGSDRGWGGSDSADN
jgi:hypothetical protein